MAISLIYCQKKKDISYPLDNRPYSRIFSLLLGNRLFDARYGKDTLNIALQMEPPALDVTSGAATIIDDVSYGTLFEGLVRLSANGQIEGWLAKNWTVSPDGKVYLFNLKDKVTFSDGRAFNAATAAYSLNRARDIHSGNVQQEALSILTELKRLHLSSYGLSSKRLTAFS